MSAEFDTENDFTLALLLAPELGSARIAKILARMAMSGMRRSDFFALSTPELIEEFHIPEISARALTKNADALGETILKYKARAAGKRLRIVSLQDPLYPTRLAEFSDTHPSLLVCYGNMNVLGARTFATLASRDADEIALDSIEKTVESCVLESKVLVTGANTKAYQRAAVVPLRWGSPRVLVLDRGVFRALGDSLDQEPFRAARLWRYRFDPETDLIVSPFRPDDEFVGINNKIRDELVVGLADEVHVVHSAKGGNTEALSAKAQALGRTVVKK